MSIERDAARSLLDLCTDFFVLGLQIKAGQVELPDSEALRRRVLLLFDEVENKAASMRVSHGDLEDARYALAAFLDEMIQYSSWSGKHDWAQNPLQAILFNESRAGTVFFERLDELRRRDSPALLVYYLCMALGFVGVYRFQDMAEHDRLLEHVSREVTRRAKALSVHATRPDDRSIADRAVAVVPLTAGAVLLSLLVVLVLYGVLWWGASGAVELLNDLARR